MSVISSTSAGALLQASSSLTTGANASSGTAPAQQPAADVTSTATQADGSTVTTVTGPTGAVISTTTTGAASQGGGSPHSAGLLNVTA